MQDKINKDKAELLEIRRKNLELLGVEFGSLHYLATQLFGYKSAAFAYQIINKAPINGNRNNVKTVTDRLARKFEIVTGKPYGWMDKPHSIPLTKEQGRDAIKNALAPYSELTYNGEIRAWDDDTPVPDTVVFVPFYKDIKLSGGSGKINDNEYTPEYKLSFAKRTLRKVGACADNVICASVDGESMAPVLNSGDTVAIDLADNQKIKDGKIYAIRQGDVVRVKRLRLLPPDKIQIISYNKEYADEIARIDEVEIIGRVFWWAVLDFG